MVDTDFEERIRQHKEKMQQAQEKIERAMRVHTPEWVDEIVSYHAPDDEQRAKFVELRAAAANLLKVICAQCPDCCDRDKAIESARQALLFANASVALKGAI